MTLLFIDDNRVSTIDDYRELTMAQKIKNVITKLIFNLIKNLNALCCKKFNSHHDSDTRVNSRVIYIILTATQLGKLKIK